MSKGKIESGEEAKSCRRSRKEEEGRDHVCGCGKSYLSYPALYTHIKTKHNGVRPEGTFKNGPNGTTICFSSNDLSKKDREKISKNMFEEDGEQKRLQEKAQLKISENILKSIEEFVKSKDLRVVNKLDGRALGFTNPHERITKEQAGYQLSQKYDELVTICDQEDQEILNNFFKLTSSTDLETVLVVYLLGVGRFVSNGMMQYYENFANAFVNCFCTHGAEVWHSICSQNKEKAKSDESNLSPKSKFLKEFFPDSSEGAVNEKECKYSPIIHEYFNRVYIIEKFEYDYYKPIMKMISEDFCKWMFGHNLTPLDIVATKNNQGFKKNLVDCREKATSTDSFQNQEFEFNVEVFAEVGVPKIKPPKKQKKEKNLEEKTKSLEESCQKESTSQNYPIVDEPYYEENIDNYYQTNEQNYENGYNCLQNYELQENLNKIIDEEIDQYFC